MITVEFLNIEDMVSTVKKMAEMFACLDSDKNTLRAGGAETASQPAQAIYQAPVMQTSPTQSPAPAAPVAPQPAPAVQPAPAIAAVPQTAPTYQAVPTTAAAYSQDDLARAAITLMDSGRQQDLRNLLAQFGVMSLPELPQAQYGAFATALRGMGAQI